MNHCKESWWDGTDGWLEYSASLSEDKTLTLCFTHCGFLPFLLWRDFRSENPAADIQIKHPQYEKSQACSSHEVSGIISLTSSCRSGRNMHSGDPPQQETIHMRPLKDPNPAYIQPTNPHSHPFPLGGRTPAHIYLCHLAHHPSKVKKERSVPYMSSVQYNGTL